jgi:hypothetical protein
VELGCDTSVTAFNIEQAVASALESEGVDFPSLFQSVDEALHGNASLLGVSGAVPSNVNVLVAGTIIIECGDNNYQHTSFEDWERNLKDGQAVSVLYWSIYLLMKTNSNQRDEHQIGIALSWELQLGCLAWPYPTPRYEPLLAHHPMLIVTSDFDGGAPTEWTTFFFETQATNSVLVVRHGDDHTSFSLSDQPSTAITKEFLRTGKLPTAKNSVEGRVSVYTQGMRRAAIPDPYQVATGEVAGDVNSGNLTSDSILP